MSRDEKFIIMQSGKYEIRGGRVLLRRTTESDLPDLMRLWNDGRVMQWVGFPHGLGYDMDRMKQWLAKLQAHQNCHHFVLHAKGPGFCGELYYARDETYPRAGLDIKLTPEAQGQGIATEALTLLIHHIFETEPVVQAVWTEPSEENISARRLYERCGLKPAPRPAEMGEGNSYCELKRES